MVDKFDTFAAALESTGFDTLDEARAAGLCISGNRIAGRWSYYVTPAEATEDDMDATAHEAEHGKPMDPYTRSMWSLAKAGVR